MMDFPERIAKLSPEQLERFQQLIKQERPTIPQTRISPLKRDTNTFPLSFAQQRLWFLEQLEPNSPIYNIPAAYRLTGSLNTSALEQSFNEIIRRHEILRTTFSTKAGQPIQVIHPNTDFTISTIDLQTLPKIEHKSRIRHLATKEAQRPFDLSQGPLLRVTLLRLDETDHILLLTMHHIVSDGWSLGVLYRELSVLYEAYCRRKPSPLPQLSVQYADFTVWQQKWLQGDVLEKQLGYWKRQLLDLPDLALPVSRPRPPTKSFRGARQEMALPSSLTEGLKSLGRETRATLFMTLLTGFKVLLHRYAGQDDIVVGIPIANRHRREVEGLIGLFTNTLILRTDLSGNCSFGELLQRVREVALNAYEHQDLPFEKLVEELQPERDLSHNPLFEVMFVLQDAHTLLHELPGLEVKRLEVDSETAKFDLTLVMIEEEGQLRGFIEYNTDLFDAPTIKRLANHYQTLLEGIVANPNLPITQLPLLTQGEKHQLLIEWNETRTNYPKDLCVHQLFEVQVDRTPDAVAVDFAGKQMTYRELNRRSNQLAHHLRALGLGPDVLVGICVERSLEMIVGVLGVLKAGGAYVPLDLTYPKERLAFMLEDTQAPILLTQHQFIERLPEHTAKVLCLDADWEVIAQESQSNLVNLVTANNLAYVMYTSGSTGKPKGISIPHQAINRLVFNTNYIDLGPSDRIAQVSNFSFDAATFEIWGALLHGARLIGIAKDVVLSPQEFARQIREQEITALFLTTALFNQLAREVPWAFNSVSHLLFGGEAVDAKWVREVLKNGPPKRLLHVYGPTESTTFTSWYLVRSVSDKARTIPIGRPISNTQIYVLDSNRQLVPVGVPGELCIGGDGLARGYLHQPELTDEKFIADPFSNVPNNRLYLTGDLARYLPDGNIEFLGRRDDQVKIRGFRIELGEIEATLTQYATVREAIVLAREDVPGDKQLVAYVIPAQKQSVTANELRRFLKQKLPDYMIPAAFVMLDALPLTPNGKMDRRSLPVPDRTMQELAETFVPPRDGLELQLTRIWEGILGTRPIGVKDNFFDVGGHSLLAVHLFAKIQKMFGQDLPLATLFQAPTIEHLANILRDEGWSPSWSSLVPIQPNGFKPPLFCAHAVGGNVLSLQALGRHLAPDQPFYALQSQGLDGKQGIPSRVEEMAAYYIEEIRTIQPKGPYFLAGQSSGGTIAFEMAQQLHRQGHQVALLALIDSPNLGRRKKLPTIATFYYRLSYHLGNILQLGPKYILQKAKDRARLVRTNIQGNVVKVIKRFRLDFGRQVPHTLRYAYVREKILQGLKSYEPQLYPGKVTYFRATETYQAYMRSSYDLRQSWGELAAGGVEIHDIPGEHNLEKEPYVGVLADELRACLDKAQTEYLTESSQYIPQP